MKTLNYKVDLIKLKLNEAEEKHISELGYKRLFENILNQLLRSKHPQGIQGVKGRIYSRILNKLDVSESELLEIEDAEFDIIKEVFLSDETTFDPEQTRLIMQYVTAVEEANKGI